MSKHSRFVSCLNNIESILILHRSLHSFRVVGMTARLMLAAFAWNCRPQHDQQDPKTPSVIWSRRRKCWVCRTRSKRAGLHPHIPVLMDRLIDVFTHKRQLPRITRPQHIEILGAQVQRPSLDELIDRRVVRYQQ